MPLDMMNGDGQGGGGDHEGEGPKDRPDRDRPDKDGDGGSKKEKEGGWFNERTTGWLGVDTEGLTDRSTLTETKPYEGGKPAGNLVGPDAFESGANDHSDHLDPPTATPGLGERIGPWMTVDSNAMSETGYLEGAWTAAGALWERYQEMKAVNTHGADDYFHCLGHCEAVEAGPGGEVVSETLGHAKEVFDFLKNVLSGKHTPDYMYKDCGKDFYINEKGREISRSGTRCNEGCRPYRKGF